MLIFRVMISIAFLLPALVFAQVDVNTLLFGVEYTFQDREMVNEPGRNTMTTPHKEEKVKEMAEHYRILRGLPRSAITEKKSWKPGLYIKVPGEPKYVINSEPVTIEFNTGPKTIAELKDAATPIFQAAERSGLVAYVNPAAERSGMGHVHIGGRTLRESVWGQNPHLLRNVFAFLHKHPAALYGFSEAFDLGMNSNIETYHNDERQNALKKVIEEYDRAVARGEIREPLDGIRIFLGLLTKYNTYSIGFFEHYRFLNLEHLRTQVTEPTPDKEGKFTVEFRNFRPPKSAEHTVAVAEFLIAMLDRLARPDHLESFEWITKSQFQRFMSATKIQSDWESIKADLEIRNPLADEMVREYVNNMSGSRAQKNLRGQSIFISNAYSEKQKKGTFFEVLIPVENHREYPSLEVHGKFVEFERVSAGGREYWIAVVDTVEMGIDKIHYFLRSPGHYLRPSLIRICRFVHAGAA